MNGTTSTKRFQAVLHQIMKLGYGNSGVYTLLENPNQELIPFMSGTDFLITFKPGVYGRIQYEKVERYLFEIIENHSHFSYFDFLFKSCFIAYCDT